MLFVSHASADDNYLDGLYDQLVNEGIDLWVDHKRIQTSDQWTMSIQNALNACDAGIYLLSPRSHNRSQCWNEILHLLGLQKLIYIVLIEPVTKEAFPYFLHTNHYAALYHDFDVELAKLILAIKNKTPLPALPAIKVFGKMHITGTIDSQLRVPMIGREADLKQALQVIRESPLFITGIGGTGKSRLAYALVETAIWSGALWHRCETNSQTEDIYILLREHYSLEENAKETDIFEQVRADSNLIVVLDNAEVLESQVRREFNLLIDALFNAGAAVCITSRIEWSD